MTQDGNHRKTDDSVFHFIKCSVPAAWFPCLNKRDKTMTDQWHLGWRVNNCFLHWCQSKRGYFPLTDALGNILQKLMTLCTRKRRCKPKEDSTMCLFPALSETHVVGKNEKAYVSAPTFLFTHYVTLAGHPTLLRVFDHLWNENNICITRQLWKTGELIYLS